MGRLRAVMVAIAAAALVVSSGAVAANAQEAPPAVSISDVSVPEGDAGQTAAAFTVSLDRAATTRVCAPFSTKDGTAVGGDARFDYVATGLAACFEPGETSVQVAVGVVGDTVDEPDETFTLEWADIGGSGVTIADGQGVATIVDDDEPVVPPALSVGDVSVVEGDAGYAGALFTVSLDQAAASPVTVQLNTADGTASAFSDYLGGEGVATFAPGETSYQVTAPVRGDTVDELDETFTLELSNPSGATIADGQGVATIVDDDDPPVLPAVSVGDVSVTEGNAGETDALFTVSLDQAAATPVSVQVDTADGTASAASGDYASGTGTVHFAPGETARAVGIPVAPDTVDEPDETFTLELSNPTGATIADGQGVATIVDDDAPFVPPELSVGDVSVVEGDAGETPAVFVVSLDHAVASPVTVQFNTGGETADGTDFAPIGGLVVFEPGVTSREVAVPVFGDTVDEPDETFIFELFDASGATIADGGPGGQGADGRGVATIVDDDDPFVPPGLSVIGFEQTEGDAGETANVFTVILDHVAETPVTVQFNTVDGTASESSADYVAAAGTVTFAPGVTAHEVAVRVVGDTLDEPDENFTLELSNPSGATIADGRGVATIVDDDEVVPTSTEVTGAPNPSTVGETVAITAAVSSSNADEPTGTVTFYDGPVSPAKVLGTVALNASGIATLSTDDLAVASHTINAVYNPDATHLGSSGSYSQTVNPAPPPKLLCVRVKLFGLSIVICL